MTTDKKAAEAAIAAWKAKAGAKSGSRRPGAAGRPSSRPSRPPGFSEVEVDALGVTLHALSGAHASAPDGEARFDEIDLLDSETYTELEAAGVPVLVLGMLAEDNQRARDEAEAGMNSADALAKCLEERGRVVAYPRSYRQAEAWLLGYTARPWCVLSSIHPDFEVAVREGHEAVARGEAVVYEEAKTAARLMKAIDHFWVANT